MAPMARARVLIAFAMTSVLSLTSCGDPAAPGGNGPPLGNVLAISAGGFHTCALRLDGKAFCWGRNVEGQLGDGTLEDRLNPVPVATSLTFTSISAGDTHSCAITAAGEAYCWGDNVQGQVGGNAAADVGLPPTLVGPQKFSMVSAGQDHTCGVTNEATAYCWGTGYLGDNLRTRRAVPILVPGGPWSFVSAAANYSCALRATGGAYCWGQNAGGLLGNGSTTGESSDPVAVVGGHSYVTLDAGMNHTCGLAFDGKTYCWGANAQGQLGTGTAGAPTGTPAPVVTTLDFTSVGSGEDFTCAANAETTYCWGQNNVGQLAINDPAVHPSPALAQVAVDAVTGFRLHSCGVTNNFDGYCWGANAFGQVGNGRTDAGVTIPVKITIPAQ